MSYDSILDQSEAEASNRLLATKILDLMDKLRLSNSQQAPKRWIWELLQNAKDVAYPAIGVDVSVELFVKSDTSKLIFKHNGQPFNSQSITFLIHQVSTKDREEKAGEPKATGKFGTGFLSTHLLSEKVLVTGFVKDAELPYRRFELQLDRSPIRINDVIKSVETSVKEIRKCLSSSKPPDKFDERALNTGFEYELTKGKVKVAEAGIADLHLSLPFTLAFSPTIRSVKVTHEQITYRIVGKPTSVGPGMELVTIDEVRGEQSAASYNIVVTRGEKASIAVRVGVDINKKITEVRMFQHEQPRLFCDFPLIGSQDFPFPAIVNSPWFNPNEPRSAVWLTDVDDTRVRENEEIMAEAVKLYKILLDFASMKGWGGLFNLIDFKPVPESEWLSRDWLDENILRPVRSVILHTPIVDNAVAGRIAILSADDTPLVRFPSGESKEIMEEIWQLAKGWMPERLPPLEEVESWRNVIWLQKSLLTFDNIATFIQERVDLNGLAAELKRDKPGAIDWLNDFFEMAYRNKSFAEKLANDEFAVFPNQNEVFKVNGALYADEQVDEYLKDALKIMELDIRDDLVHMDVFTGDIEYTPYNQQQIVDQINSSLLSTKIEEPEKYKACDFIVTLFADDPEFPTAKREAIYEFSRRMYPTTVDEKRQLSYYHPDIYSEADKIQVRAIVGNVADEKTVDGLTTYLGFQRKQETLSWLYQLIEFLVNNAFESQLDRKQAILPNQNGTFTPKDNLNLDDGEIPEVLKDISASLGVDFRDELLDMSIFLELPKTRVTTASDVAGKITELVRQKISEFPRPQETKDIFRKLYLYFSKNQEEAKRLFTDLYNSKHLLLDDTEIAANMEKAQEVDELMEEYDIKDINGLRALIQRATKLEQTPGDGDLGPFTKETLAALGIRSEEDLIKLVGEDPSSGAFRHVSSATPEMYVYANSIIDRTRRNVIARLKTLPEYQVDDSKLDELARTVIGGITKMGLDVPIVFRPSDNGQVLFYYPSEKATLDLPNAELWIDDGLSPPGILSLGRILTITRINRIPIK